MLPYVQKYPDLYDFVQFLMLIVLEDLLMIRLSGPVQIDRSYGMGFFQLCYQRFRIITYQKHAAALLGEESFIDHCP